MSVKDRPFKICSSCIGRLTRVMSPVCKRCGKPIGDTRQELCRDCRQRKQTYFIQGFSVWEYDDMMKKSIAHFKYDGRREYADFYISEMIFSYGEKLKSLHFDMVIPVPLHKEKLRFRGFNQAEVLAAGLSKALQIPLETKLLYRIKNTKPQKGLNDKERDENIRHAFCVASDRLRFQKKCLRVLLVDDIYTTGTTINQCARELVCAGVNEIYFISMCTGKDF